MSHPEHELTKTYSLGNVTVEWRATQCIHSGVCVRGLHAVFNPKRKPWIVLENATPEEIIAQVAKCPSGALRLQPKSE